MIEIDPNVPEWMDDKDLNDRSEEHMNEWFGKAYIRTQKFGDDSYQEYCDRMAYTQADDYLGDYKLDTEEEFNTRRTKDLKSWCAKWGDDGIRYTVRCLDGGAWDRTTNHGSFANVDEAIALAESITKK